MTTTGRPATGTDHATGRPSASMADRPRKGRGKGYPRWPVILLAGSAFVAIWGGWVELGRMSGFGPVNLLPGITEFYVDLSITLPLGMEVYAAYALGAWLTRREIPDDARSFARWSALVSLVGGAGGQIAYHLLAAAGVERAPWPVLVTVACIPVAVLGMASALAHRLHAGTRRGAVPASFEASTAETVVAPLVSGPLAPVIRPEETPTAPAAEHDLADQPTAGNLEHDYVDEAPAPITTPATETDEPADRPAVEASPLPQPGTALAEESPEQDEAPATSTADRPAGHPATKDPEPSPVEELPVPVATPAAQVPAPIARPVEVPPLPLPVTALAEQEPAPAETPAAAPATSPADRPATVPAPVLVQRRARPAGPVTDDERDLILSLAANPDVSEREIARRTGRSRDTIKRTIDNHRPTASRQDQPTGRPADRPATGFTVPAT